MMIILTSSKVDLLSCLLPLICLVAKESCCKPLGRSIYTGLCSFWSGRFFDQSCSTWHKRWGICLALPFPSQQQSSPERKLECSSQGCWSHFNNEQGNGRLRVGKCSFTVMSSRLHLNVQLEILTVVLIDD